MSTQYDKTTAGTQYYVFEVIFFQGIYRQAGKIQRKRLVRGVESMIYRKYMPKEFGVFRLENMYLEGVKTLFRYV